MIKLENKKDIIDLVGKYIADDVLKYLVKKIIFQHNRVALICTRDLYISGTPEEVMKELLKYDIVKDRGSFDGN